MTMFGYRRADGQPLDAEPWVAKRLALLRALAEIGGEPVAWLHGPAEVGALLVEAAETVDPVTEDIVALHNSKRPVVWVCDDPLLAAARPWRRAVVWRNATRYCATAGRESDVSFGALLTHHEPCAPVVPRVLYDGRAGGGRAEVVARLLDMGAPIDVVGDAAQWRPWGVETACRALPPNVRHAAYRRYVCVLGLAERGQMRMGWRTGRVQHAVAAGVPVLVDAGHNGFGPEMLRFRSLGDARDVLANLATSGQLRERIVRRQQAAAVRDRGLLGEAVRCLAVQV